MARVPDADAGPGGRVVFVRHALPGETVDIEVTEGTEGDRFWRADAVAVAVASPDRVEPPCPYAGPDACGGCDFQHVALPAQRALKAAVVREQLRRLAGLDVPVEVEAVPGDRRRAALAHPAALRRAPRRPARHAQAPLPRGGARRRVPARGRRRAVVRGAGAGALGRRGRVLAGPPGRARGAGRDGARPAAAAARRVGARPLRGRRALRRGAARLGRAGSRLVAVEADRQACTHARRNLGDAVEVADGPVAQVLASSYDEPFDLVVLDPPREGARRAVVEQVADRRPRAVAYVACDPAALARDVAIFAEHGYRLAALRAFDLFPMTHHVECVALLTRTGS